MPRWDDGFRLLSAGPLRLVEEGPVFPGSLTYAVVRPIRPWLSSFDKGGGTAYKGEKFFRS